MARVEILCVLLCLGALGQAARVSPVQKVIELLDDCKAKIVRDLAAEEKAMEEYSGFCDKEQEEKGYAIKDATRLILQLQATVEDGKSTIAQQDDELAKLGAEMAENDREMANITAVRKTEKDIFASTETELVTSVDELTRAVVEIKKGTSFLQIRGAQRAPEERMKAVTKALSAVVDAAWIGGANKRALKSFLQQAQGEQEDLKLHLGQAPEVDAFASHTGGIVETLEEMKEKAENSLSDARREESEKQHSYDMMAQSINKELTLAQEKKADATSNREAKAEEMGKAEAELAEVTKTKAADETYVSTLSVECQKTADAWAARQAEAKEEMAAVEKAKEILSTGVKVFVQTGTRVAVKSDDDFDGDESSKATLQRSSLVGKLKDMARKYHSFALMEMASAAASDPFAKIRGLIEDMVTKLVNEANAEATQKGFCDEEIGKSKKSEQEKKMDLEKLTTRGDKASAAKDELDNAIKELEAEIAEIDTAQSEATKIRTQEHEDNSKAAKDFRDSAEAVERAIIVLKQYYEGALIQVVSKTMQNNAQRVASKQPTFGSAKSDAGSSIISILEMAAEDFTKTYTEVETGEDEAAKDYEKLSQENKVSRSAKEAEVKAKQSEIKSLTVTIENSKMDADGVSKELDAVTEYLAKLKPQCETKVMSYEERKSKRESEIAGLKEALEILNGQAI